MQYGSPQGPGQYGAMQYDAPPKRKTKKRIAVVAAVSAACLASAGVYATALTVTANQDAAGSAAVTACDNSVVTHTSVPAWDATAQKFKIATITVSDIDEDCDGQTVYLQILKEDGTAERAALTHVYADATDEGTYAFDALDLAADVYGGTAVVIHQTS